MLGLKVRFFLESGEEIASKILKTETTHVTAKESKRVALPLIPHKFCESLTYLTSCPVSSLILS